MSEQQERIDTKEYKIVSYAIFQLVCKYADEYAADIMVDLPIFYLTKDSSGENCVLVNADSENSVYRKKFIDGGFEADIPIQITYECKPNTAPQKVNAQEVLDRLMQWLSNTTELPKLTDGRKIKEIVLGDSFAVPSKEKQDGSTTFVSNATLTYKKKGLF